MSGFAVSAYQTNHYFASAAAWPAASSSTPAETASSGTTLQQQIGPAYTVELSNNSNWNDPEVRQMKRTGQIECQTCKERKYQDGSDDPGVSFKAPGNISPESSAAVVQAHEQEHVANEQANARSEGRKVVAQSVKIFTSVCPECGKAYVSGGETQTTTAADNSKAEADDKAGINIKV